MGATKRHIHKNSDLELADLFKSLAHPARIRIINELLENENLNCTELCKRIPLAQSTISQHLKELYTKRILGYTAIANCAYYYVNQEVIQKLISYIIRIKKMLSKSERDLVNFYILPKLKIVGSPSLNLSN